MPDSTSNRLKKKIPEIMDSWEKRALKEINFSEKHEPLVLRNSLSEYLTQMSDALSNTIDRTSVRKKFDKAESTRLGKHHGKVRAEGQYTMDQLILEYHILRQVICDILEEGQILTPTEREVIVCSIEQAVNDAATEFSNTLNGQTLELKAANQELHAFSYSVSHDLRAPLRSIDGFSQLLIEDYSTALDDTAKGYLERIRNNSQKMAQLIDDLMLLSRVSRTELVREKVDISYLGQHILNNHAKADPSRRVGIEVASECIAVADPGLLRIVLENLISNAWKYTSKTIDSKVKIGCEELKDPNSEMVYFVEDNGAGFNMAHVDQLFQAFHRLHSVKEFPGTGIGLATVKRIIDRHGGKVWANGSPGKGACFRFTLGKENREFLKQYREDMK